ncbi:MAG TPA: tetratricopeptide repeat protein [Thermoanaerobaculia bacterium]|jgi:tetratricopeptide (TPR) repeat protein|nr:tetratricopeptide repeat protein [Thermoanaerobaculia bacterium]
MPKPKVFISYSHLDRAWKDRLVKHLQVLVREERLDLWDDSRIPAGADWLAEIQEAIQSAEVAVLLVSVDFLNSRFIRETEVPAFLVRRKAEGLHVFPVIVDECLWREVQEISSMQARPLDGRPLAGFVGTGRNRELVAIAREILHLVGADSALSLPTKPEESLRPLHQLPAPPADFVGRQAELAELRAAMSYGGCTICGLQGMGGVGKTALALKLAHEFRDAFPDGQIYLDLRGMSEAPVTPDEAKAHVIRSFYPEAPLPEGPQLGALYREVLHDKRVLLLLDNAAGREQVDSLVPPSTCTLLVTSRRRFALPGIFRQDLDQLPENDACDLLRKISPRVGDQASSIARLCGFLPFALRVAASTLLERADLKLSHYVQRLAQEGQKAKLGEAALGVSYALLPETLQTRFRALAVFPASFDAAAAAAVWSLSGDEEETDEALGELVRRSLLDGEDGRYKLHDLTRAFAGMSLRDEEKEVARARHANHFLAELSAATDLYLLGNENILAGLSLFDRERDHILAGQAWAAERAAISEDATRVASQFPYSGAHLLKLRLSPNEQIHWVEAGLTAARSLGDRLMEGAHLGDLGIAYAALGETRRAIERFEQYLALSRETGDRRGESNALGNLGNAYAEFGETRRAIELYAQDVAIRRDLGDRRGEGNALGNLGTAYADLGETRQAIELYEQRLEIAREIGDRRGGANASWNLGSAYEKLGEIARAMDCMQACVDFELEVGHPDAEKDAAHVEELREKMSG